MTMRTIAGKETVLHLRAENPQPQSQDRPNVKRTSTGQSTGHAGETETTEILTDGMRITSGTMITNLKVGIVMIMVTIM